MRLNEKTFLQMTRFLTYRFAWIHSDLAKAHGWLISYSAVCISKSAHQESFIAGADAVLLDRIFREKAVSLNEINSVLRGRQFNWHGRKILSRVLSPICWL